MIAVALRRCRSLVHSLPRMHNAKRRKGYAQGAKNTKTYLTRPTLLVSIEEQISSLPTLLRTCGSERQKDFPRAFHQQACPRFLVIAWEKVLTLPHLGHAGPAAIPRGFESSNSVVSRNLYSAKPAYLGVRLYVSAHCGQRFLPCAAATFFSFGRMARAVAGPAQTGSGEAKGRKSQPAAALALGVKPNRYAKRRPDLMMKTRFPFISSDWIIR